MLSTITEKYVTLTTLEQVELWDWLQREKNIDPSIFFMLGYNTDDHRFVKEFKEWQSTKYDYPRLPDKSGTKWANSDWFNHNEDANFTPYYHCNHNFHGLFGDTHEYTPHEICVCFYCGLHEVSLTHRLSDADESREYTTYTLTADGKHGNGLYVYGSWHTRSPLNQFDPEQYGF